MAVLSLLLANDARAWSEPDLHELRAKHAWTATAKVLRLHFHLIGARSIEERVFGDYLARIRTLHPEAELPALFQDGALFENAEQLRARIGDEAFFEPMNPGAGASGGGLKKFAKSITWNAATFSEARQSGDADRRGKLFSSLVRSHFPAFTQGSTGYVSFGVGLAVITRHAQALGYQAVVLFLDELILWMASRANDSAWLSAEVPKLANLVESNDAQRPIPLISYVARQRDISELVGDQVAGAQHQALRDSLRWWEGRFETIRLEDRNLPAVVSKRIVRAKDAAARQQLDDAFSRMRQLLSPVDWQALLGPEGTELAFRQVYPFSPTLIDALVALSQTLQRERTALKVLMEMLVEHLEDFQLGKVVPVGDLYDVLAGGEEPMDGAMRVRFQLARRLYVGELLPVIQRVNGTGSREKCQRMREDHRVALGCSNCRENRCRADNRLVKTLLLSALVPQARTLENLTVTRLVQLNWGTLRTPVPGAEMQAAVQRLREIASSVGKLSVGEGGDPPVSVRIEGVDLQPILQQARNLDTHGRRKKKLQEVLFTALGLQPGESAFKHKHVWRGTDREGTVLFGNVRELQPEQLAAAEGEDFRICIDYPFDIEGRSPGEDEQAVDAFLEQGRSSPTLVWLPSFLSEKMMVVLSELVVVDELLGGDTLRNYVEHLRPDDQGLARGELQNLSSQKRQQLRRALEVAYGLKAGDLEVDPARTVQNHFRLLNGSSSRIGGLRASSLANAIPDAINDMLELRHPRHPTFTEKVTVKRLEHALAHLETICEEENQRASFDKAQLKELDPAVQLGFVTPAEGSATLRTTVTQALENALATRGLVRPTITQMRVEVNSEEKGYTDEVTDFCVMAFAAATKRELQRHGRALGEMTLGKLPFDAELVLPPLPQTAPWAKALDVAGTLFGITLGGRALHASNLRQLSELLEAKRKEALGQGAGAIAELLGRWSSFSTGPVLRQQTAESVAELLLALDVRDPVEQVNVLHRLVAKTSLTAMARHLTAAHKTAEALRNDLAFESLESLRGSSDIEAQGLMEELGTAVAADQVVTDLAPAIQKLAIRAQQISRRQQKRPDEPVVPKPPEPTHPTPGQSKVIELSGNDLRSLDEKLAEVRAQLANDPGAVVAWTVRLTRNG
jgi:hypothetical protein